MRSMCLLLCLVGGVIAIRAAAAPNWVEISTDKAHISVQIDAESVKTLDDGRIEATWRSLVSKADNYEVTEGIVDCEEESILVTRTRHITMDPKKEKPAYVAWIYDYAKGKYMTAGTASDLRPEDALKRHQYPLPFLHHASPLVHLCGQRYASPEQRQPMLSEMRVWLDCANPPLESTTICGTETGIGALLAGLPLRLKQAARACGIDEGRIADVRNGWRRELVNCADNPDCPSNIAQSHAAALSRDLARVAEHMACEYLPKAAAETAANAERDEAFTRYTTCTREQYAQLEDGSSPHVTLAHAIIQACDDRIAPILKKDSDFMRMAPLALSGEIGEWREARKKK